MQKIFESTEELKSIVTDFEDRLDVLDRDYKDFLLVSNVNGEPVSSLNDIVGIVAMPFRRNKGFSAILYYFTELDIPENIKDKVEGVFNELFYSA